MQQVGTIRMVGSHTDMTERKDATAALQESQRMLATLMDNLPGMAYRCHNDRRWTMEICQRRQCGADGIPTGDADRPTSSLPTGI
jgi:PAS domain-containing protein